MTVPLRTNAALYVQDVPAAAAPSEEGKAPIARTLRPDLFCLSATERDGAIRAPAPGQKKGGQGSLLLPAANYQRVGYVIHLSLVCPDSALAVNAGEPTVRLKKAARVFLAHSYLSARTGRQTAESLWP